MREKEYSEWMSKQGFDLLRHANCCKIAFNGGWESRQTEVDELQKQLIDQGQRFNEQSQRVKDLEHKNVELQKRVDDVIQKSKEFIQFSKNNADIFEDEYEAGKAYGAEAVIELLEQALNGGEE